MSNEVSQDVTNTIEVAEMDQQAMPGGYNISYKEPGLFQATPTHLTRIIDIYADDYTEPYLVSSDVFEDILSKSAFINDRLSQFTYYSAKLRVTVVVNGSPTVAGRFLLAFQPWVRYPSLRINMATGDNDLTIPQAYTMPHIEIDPSVSKTYTLDLPTPTVTGLFNKDATIEGIRRQESYRAWWVPVVPPIGGTATTPDVSNTIYFSFAEIEPGAIHNSGVADMELNDKNDEEDDSKLSSMLTTASNIADKASSFPVIGPYASTFSGVAKSAAGALNMFGYSKPTDEKVEPFIQIRDISNMSHLDNGFEGYSLSSNAKNSVAIGDVMGFGKEDDMSIPAICKKQGYVGKFSIPTTASPMTQIAGFRVTPSLCPTTSVSSEQVALDPTPMAHMASLFSWWHGTIDFEFEIVCTAYHRCTLLFAYTPYASTTPSFDTALNVLNNTNVTVSGNTTVNMSIPWRRPFPWLPTSGYGRPYGYQTSDIWNGTIWIYVVNPVTSNGSTDAIEVIVKTKSDDMQLALPTLRHYNNIADNKNTLINWKGITPDPPAAARFRGKAQHNSVVEESDPNPMFGDSFGENAALSTKALASKMSYVTTLSFQSKNSITVPNSPLWVSDNGIPNWVRTDPNQCWTYQSALSIGYLGCRGGTNVGLLTQATTPDGTVTNPPRAFASISGRAAQADGVQTNTLFQSRAYKYSNNAFTQQYAGLDSKNLFFTVPHNLPYPMRILNRETQFYNSDGIGDYYYVGFESKGTTGENVSSVALCTGAADDFSFIWYLCPTKMIFFANTEV